MAERLKDRFGAEVPARIAEMIGAVHPAFDRKGSVAATLGGYEPLELMDRGRAIARTLKVFLPGDYPEAIDILVRSLGPEMNGSDNFGMTPFLYLPHTIFVADNGIDHFEPSMRAQYELTKRFTAEFSVRTFLDKRQEETLERLRMWASDANVHVRRLVSEGTRPRLPWAQRLRAFQADPAPVLELLELLKDDPELYVRRSVANNLNDIGKDHPSVLIETVRRWSVDAPEERQRLIRHALRSAVKRGEADAIGAMGYSAAEGIRVGSAEIMPAKAQMGDIVRIGFSLVNEGEAAQSLLVDFAVHFVKANGMARTKVFKLTSVSLAPGETAQFSKALRLDDLTTRKHYPGLHRIDAMVNGVAMQVGEFVLGQ
ncbi:DNA alkylation repair protein [Rhizobium sp. CNPSo 3464]|uniref:DNA alkylation repair protein n=1 Tax=Rhizobium sp. CNPSo 3464 TaxID=3021406 RepID=UPI00254EC6BC|nr:DNA alkylation repair protein [Rhizobium sp. CNPSo 3464]MDK4737826.1 DNA alkylation repair protein [Rhizobium sp. CNPSo 3464]